MWLTAATIADQVNELTQRIPQIWQNVREQLDHYPWSRLLLEQAPRAAESLVQSGGASRVTGLASGAASFFEAVIVVSIVGIFGAADPETYERGLLFLVPPKHRSRVSQTLDETADSLQAWLLGQGVLMVVIGLTTALGLKLLGVPLALTLGLLTGLLELIPYVGAWIAFIPAALISLQMGSQYLAMTLALYGGLHILEGYVIGPLVQRRAVHLPPALALMAQVLMGEWFGVLGLFVASPLVITAIVCVKRLYVEDALGETAVDQPKHPPMP